MTFQWNTLKLICNTESIFWQMHDVQILVWGTAGWGVSALWLNHAFQAKDLSRLWIWACGRHKWLLTATHHITC